MPTGVYIKTREHKEKISKTMKGRMPKFIPDNTGIKRTPEQKERYKEGKKKNPSRYWLGKKRKPFSKEWKRKIQMTMIENRESNHLWKGGKSFEKYPSDWRDTLKESIRERDNYICQECGLHQDEIEYKLHVHHIDYNKANVNPDNLITLCRICHIKTNFNRDYWLKYFKNNDNS